MSAIQPLIDLLGAAECRSPCQQLFPCLHTVKDALIEVAGNLGYDRARFAYRQSDAVLNTDKWFYGSNFPALFETDYYNGDFYTIDPLVRFAEDQETPHSFAYGTYGTWQEYKELGLKKPLGNTKTAKQQYKNKVNDLFKLCDSHDVRGGVFMSAKRFNDVFFVSMAGKTPHEEHDKCVTPELWLALKHSLVLLDSALMPTTKCERCHSIQVMSVKLTSSQVRLLKLFHENPTANIARIASLYGREVTTVNQHLQNIRKAINAEGSGFFLAAKAKSLGCF